MEIILVLIMIFLTLIEIVKKADNDTSRLWSSGDCTVPSQICYAVELYELPEF